MSFLQKLVKGRLLLSGQERADLRFVSIGNFSMLRPLQIVRNGGIFFQLFKRGLLVFQNPGDLFFLLRVE